MRRRSARGGFTLLELIVVLAVLGVMAGVVGLALRPEPRVAPDARAAWRRTVATTRARALATGRPVHVTLAPNSMLTALPDGSVLAPSNAPLDRLTGAPEPDTTRPPNP